MGTASFAHLTGKIVGLALLILAMVMPASGQPQEPFDKDNRLEGAPFGLAGKARITLPAKGTKCTAALLFSVGTAMRNEDYDNFAKAIVGSSNKERGYVVVVLDPNPGLGVKIWSPLYTNSVQGAKNSMKDWLGEECANGITHYVVGGHSAGGYAAYVALADTPDLGDAIFSLDPYWFRAVTEKINKPGMYWGFTEASCLVDVEKAARNFYKATNYAEGGPVHRTLYVVHSTSGDSCLRGGGGCQYGHCSFVNDGDCRVCLTVTKEHCDLPLHACRTSVPPDFNDKIATSFVTLVHALEANDWSKTRLTTPDQPGTTVFTAYVDADTP